MSFEVNLDSVGFDAYSNPICADTSRIDTRNFHKAIFSPSSHPCKPMHKIAPMGNVSAEAGVTISWGGEEGTTTSGYVSGSASDNNGNTGKISAEIKNDGSGSASASVSHTGKKNS